MTQTRATSPEVILRREGRALVAPFSKKIPRWYSRCVYLRAFTASQHSTSEQSGGAVAELRAMLDEIEATHRALIAATSDAAQTSPVIDAHAAFRRLIENFRSALKANQVSPRLAPSGPAV